MNNSNIDYKLLNHSKCDIFTPDNISQLMAKYLHNSGSLLEPSVGVGNLLKYLPLNKYSSIDVFDIKHDYLHKIHVNDNIHINKFNTDFLKHNFDKQTRYDNIILNPPYIRIQNLSDDYKKFIRDNFNICNTGNYDLYYIFILKCISLLSDNGVIVSITPNSFLYNKSSKILRKYLLENNLISEIIDFKTKKIFKHVSTYCCITIINKLQKNHLTYNNEIYNYSIINNPNNIFYNIFWNNSHNSNNSDNSINLTNLNNVNKKLKDIAIIKNGIATLRDKIYIHNTKLYDEECWKKITNGKEIKYIIYPYDDFAKIIPETIFKESNPLTYEFLSNNKDELLKRDKGKKEYSTWYAYGRTQGIVIPSNNFNNNIIYIPIFIYPEKFTIYQREPMLHYSCISINLTQNIDLNIIIKNIYDSIDFIKQNCSKRGGGWINLSSTIIKEIEYHH